MRLKLLKKTFVKVKFPERNFFEKIIFLEKIIFPKVEIVREKIFCEVNSKNT